MIGLGHATVGSNDLDTPGEVDALHAKALAPGGADEGAPGERGPEFYMSYFRDLDGNKLCAFHLGGQPGP